MQAGMHDLSRCCAGPSLVHRITTVFPRTDQAHPYLKQESLAKPWPSCCLSRIANAPSGLGCRKQCGKFCRIRSQGYTTRRARSLVPQCQGNHVDPAPLERLMPIRISTQHAVTYGEIIRIVGSGSALGDWNPEEGPGMQWSEGDIWSVEVKAPPGEYDFKCVVIRQDGSIAEWEPGENRCLKVPTPEAQTPVLEVVCPWSDTSSTFLSFDEDDVVARLEASETQESVKLGGSENSTNPAGNSAKESEEGLAKLDADAGIDSTSVEDKVERVATAIERDEESPNEGMDHELNRQPVNPASGTPSSDSEGLGKLDKDIGKGETKSIEETIQEVSSAMGLEEQAEDTQDNGNKKSDTKESDDSKPVSGDDGPGLAKLDADFIKDSTSVEDKVEAVAAAIKRREDNPAEAQQDKEQMQKSAEQDSIDNAEGLGKLDAGNLADDRSIEQKIEEVAQAMGLEDSPKESPEEGIKPSSNSQPSNVQKPSIEKPIPSADQASSTLSSIAEKAEAPSRNFQSFTGFLGLLAIPIVAWSEYTLKTTGPGGLLGAVEGLSYAAIVAGVTVLGFQLKDFGYIPAALPDSKCFGNEAALQLPELSVPPALTPTAPTPAAPAPAASTPAAPTPAAANREQSPSPAPKPLPTPSDAFRELLEKVKSAPTTKPLAKIDFGEFFKKLKEKVNPSPKSAADLPFLKKDINNLGRFFGAGEAKAAELQPTSAERGPDPMTEAMKGVQNFFTGPQLTMEELSSGVEDGLSSADLEPVVEELKQALSKLSEILSGFKSQMQTRKAASANQFNQNQAPSQGATPAAIHYSGTEQMEIGSARGHDGLPSFVAQDPASRRLDQAYKCRGVQDFSSPTSQMPLRHHHRHQAPMREIIERHDIDETPSRRTRLVGMDMGISIAATNAASAANNVTQNLNTAINQLQSNIEDVQGVVKEISSSGDGSSVDLSRLSASVTELEESLKKTKESTPPQASLLPLVDELDRVARDLRSGGSAEDAEKIEIAAASIRQAASADLTIIDKATSTVTKQAEALPKSNQEAVDQPKKEVEPVISSVENVKALLQSAVDSLNALREAQDSTIMAPTSGMSSQEAPSVSAEQDSDP